LARRYPLFTVLYGLAIAGAGPQAHAGECQARLEAAVAAITASGSFRAQSVRLLNGKPISEQQIEFQPPTNARFRELTRLEGKDLAAMTKRLEDLPLEMRNTETPWMTYIGDTMYLGAERQPFGDPERATTPPGQLFGLSPFADPTVYFAKKCKADRITFEWDPYALTAMMQHGEDEVSFATVNAERKTLRAEDDAAFNEVTTVARGTLELDAKGRPVRIQRDDPMPAGQFEELVKLLFPDVEIAKGSTLSIDIALAYDQSLRIAVPE
jgi:hypothetical protein